MTDSLRSVWAMLRLAWRHSPARIVTALALTFGSALAWPVVALSLRAAIDAVVRHDPSAATVAGAVTAFGTIGVLVLQQFAYTAYVQLTETGEVALEAELMALANGSARLEHHERPDFADKITVLRQELSGLMYGIGGLLQMIALTISLSVTGVLLAFVNPWLLLLPVFAVPSVLAGQRATSLLERGKDRAAAPIRRSWHLIHLATERAAAKEVRVLRLQDELRRRNAALWNEAGTSLRRAERQAAFITTAGQIFFAIGYVVAVLVAIRQAVVGRSGVGDVVLVITLAAQVTQQMNSALQELRNLQRVATGFTRLRWLRDQVATAPSPSPDTSLPDGIRTGIMLRQAGFTYPGTDRPVLSNVDLLLPAGSTVAIVGENGAGKTTLVKLLCRFYDPTSGTIALDGVDIRRFPLDEWRSRIAAGFQDFVRFEFVVQRAVGVGDLPNVDNAAAVRGALDRAYASDVVDHLADGLATQLGKAYADGVELSGGQWQKLALGRAMMRERPLLLILDEPTAALDAEAEHKLFERYADHARQVGQETGAITVLVSHRFSTVRSADLILVVADGAIVERGDHDTLIAQGGLYAELYGLQAAAYQAPAASPAPAPS